MRLIRRAACLMAIATLCVAPASASIITFDDIGGFTDRANFPALGLDTGYAGAQWPTTPTFMHWGVANNSDNQFGTVGAYSGDQVAWNWSDGPTRSIIFDSVSLVNGAYFNVFMANVDWGAATVQFRGYDETDTLIGSSGTINLDRDSNAPAWQYLEFNQAGVKRLEIVSTNDRFGGQGWWVMDDLTINEDQQVVPEPGSLVIWSALGALGLVARRYRRKKN